MAAVRHQRFSTLSSPALAFALLASASADPVTAQQPAQSANPPLPTARLLVELAKDHSLRPEQSPADLQHINILLAAAVRVDPALPDAHRWLYELATLGGDLNGATTALGRLVRYDPTNRPAFEHWLDLSMASAQSIEERSTFLTRTLENADMPQPWQASIHLRLASLGLEALDHDRAHMQLDRALAVDAENPEAARLRLELLGDKAAPHVQVGAAMNVFRTNPVNTQWAWYVGQLLTLYGFGEDADRFYQHALEIQRLTNAGEPIPAGWLMDLSHNSVLRGRLDEAVDYARQALAVEPGSVEAEIHLHWLLRKQGKSEEAQATAKRLAGRFSQLKDVLAAPLEELAQAAWFYCTVEPQPRAALILAEAAARQAGSDPFVTRVLGWAQILNQRTQEAAATLGPVARADPYAAYQLARLRHESGDAGGARRIIDNLRVVPAAGQAHDLLMSLGLPSATSQPSGRRYPELADLLTDFDPGILEFHKEPGRYITAEITVENTNLTPGEPWWAVFTVTNNANFPVTLGPGGMLNPVFMLSFELEGERARGFPDLFTVSIDRARVIPPNQSVRLRETIDLGPVRRISRQTPQQLLRVTLSAILDPQNAGGTWSPSLTGQRLKPVFFNRLPVATGGAGIQALFANLSGDSELDRYGSVEVMAELLGEAQRAEMKRLAYEPAAIPAGRIKQALLEALNSPDWQMRARTLDALQIVGFDQRMLDAVRRCLKHEHWLVRLMAVRLLGEREGRGFEPSAKVIVEQDKDELVRELAQCYLQRNAATTQPAPESSP